MKILYVITQADGGGAQQYVLQLARYFGGEIAAGTEDTILFEAAEKYGLRTHRLHNLKRNISPISDFLALFELIELIKKVEPDIVHLNSSKAGFLGSLIKPFINAKIVFTAHGFIFNEPFSPLRKQFYLSLEKFASFFRDYIIAVSDADRRSALANHLISRGKITVIHNGMPLISFLARNEARAQLQLPEHVFVFGTVANLYKTKAIDMLIDSVAALPVEIKEKAVWIIMGEGPEGTGLRFKVKDLGLSNTILMPGKIPNAKRLLRAFDVFVLPSRKEGFPYTLLEAMQAALPIVATSAGGNGEAVGDAGMFVPPENSAALTKALQGIFVDEEIRKLLAQKSFERSRLFTEEKMLKDTEGVYKKVLFR